MVGVVPIGSLTKCALSPSFSPFLPLLLFLPPSLLQSFSLSLPPRPFWLSPCQVMIVPVASRFDEYGLQVSHTRTHHHMHYLQYIYILICIYTSSDIAISFGVDVVVFACVLWLMTLIVHLHVYICTCTFTCRH